MSTTVFVGSLILGSIITPRIVHLLFCGISFCDFCCCEMVMPLLYFLGAAIVLVLSYFTFDARPASLRVRRAGSKLVLSPSAPTTPLSVPVAHVVCWHDVHPPWNKVSSSRRDGQRLGPARKAHMLGGTRTLEYVVVISYV